MSEPISIPMIVIVKAALSSLHQKKYEQTMQFLEMIEDALEPKVEAAKKPRKRRKDARVPIQEVAS